PMSSGVDVMFAVEELAAALAPAPFVGALLATELLALASAPSTLIDAVVNGEARYGIALTRQLDGLADLNSLKGAVCFGVEGAEAVLALKRDGKALRIVVLPLSEARVLDGADPTRRLSELEEGVTAGEVVGDALSQDALDRWTALALSLVCADIVGAMRQGLTDSVEYAKTRIQYDVPIGSFQAVQHMLAEMLVQTEAAASVTRYAAWSVDELDPAESLLAARTAKAYCGAAAQALGEALMQSYGGIGQTWEHVAHLRTRRALLDRALFGDESYQLLQIADARMGRG
ncbi:MAG TPA: acyl-CoA dehydrogenase family protein, partial [Verrucomicrobiae bacterium]|nr:acyl-CoA dehydrogenase family protein [Verrucomicrobiae bacterium]